MLEMVQKVVIHVQHPDAIRKAQIQWKALVEQNITVRNIIMI